MKTTIAALALFLATTTMAFAGDGMEGGHHHRHGRQAHARLAERLNLSDQQKDQMKALRQASREKNKEVFQAFHAKRTELQELRKANDPRAQSVAAELEAMRPQLQAIHKESREQFLSVLTPEQRQQLEQMRQK